MARYIDIVDPMEHGADVRVMLVPARCHGRVLVRDGAAGRGVLLGFHGYAEGAAAQMDRLRGIPGAEAWTLVSVQGLNRFYRGRSEDVVAGWMTRQDREHAIRDTIAYVDEVMRGFGGRRPVVCIGFSQGVATAFRAAVRGTFGAAGVIAVGGDVPPELLDDEQAPFPPTLLSRGRRDEWYAAGRLARDAAALRARGAAVEVLEYDGGHQWTAEVAGAAGRFLAFFEGGASRGAC